LGVGIQNFTQLDGCSDFYVILFGVADEILQWIRQQVCIKFYANLEKSATEILSVIRQAFGEGNISRTRVFGLQTEKCERGEEQSQEYVHHFL
jgi:hypothetical protein